MTAALTTTSLSVLGPPPHPPTFVSSLATAYLGGPHNAYRQVSTVCFHVIGEQPTLEPGDCYEYTSGTPLTTPSGIMTGTYQMENERGEEFDVDIPAFSLDSPYQPVLLN